MNDPIRAWHQARQYRGFTLPDPPPVPAEPYPVESLTPGAGMRADPEVPDVFNRFLRDQLDGAYGSTIGSY
ncbi:hypothetical protein [Nonomuraea jiangxiensis]|uniref:Uncharacterized protein n=1 Tax=Nonomuraea jiangxiensis TaxID=633440 RepID=A0A1G8XTH8_9ACTN|nr:hypothetical protein [Nonomuraea jiangxiensis]SDJ93851.1 hypothetical protein SAMN05421869_11371 [Nonomuraea jiangxiensis]